MTERVICGNCRREFVVGELCPQCGPWEVYILALHDAQGMISRQIADAHNQREALVDFAAWRTKRDAQENKQ